MLDLWHVDVNGKYSAGDGDFKNRARILTDESGAYELEGLHPVAYQPGGDGWRCPHIHLLVEAAGYKRLITEMVSLLALAMWSITPIVAPGFIAA